MFLFLILPPLPQTKPPGTIVLLTEYPKIILVVVFHRNPMFLKFYFVAGQSLKPRFLVEVTSISDQD